MGRRGVPPAPTNLKVLKGTQSCRINRHEPVPREALPDAPEWLDADERAIWDYTLGELKAMRLAQAVDREALAAYCKFTVQFVRACDLVAKGGLLLKGDKGRVVRNPAIVVQEHAALMMAKFGLEFGLTPRARSEIKLQPPDADKDELNRLLS